MSHLKKALEKAKAERTILLGNRSEERAGDEQGQEVDDVFKYLHKRIDQTFELRNAQVSGVFFRKEPPSPREPQRAAAEPAPAAIPEDPSPAPDAEQAAAASENTALLEADLEDALRDVTLDLEQDLKDVTLEDVRDLERELRSALSDAGGAPPPEPSEDAPDSAGMSLNWQAKLLEALRITDETSCVEASSEAGPDANGAPCANETVQLRESSLESGTAVADAVPDGADMTEASALEGGAICRPVEAEGALPREIRAETEAPAMEFGEHPGGVAPLAPPRPEPTMPGEAIGYTRTRVVRIPEEIFVRNKLVAALDDSPANEQFKLLRTQLFQYTRHRGLNTIQISGFGPGDGASLIALNLALSIAKDARQTTVLVDLNFRNPSIARLLGLEEGPGLRSHLMDGVPLEEIFISPGIRKLTVLLAGGTLTNPTELLGSPGMESLLRELKGRYGDRYVIVDTPGISECPDPLVISEYVDGLVLVARARRTPQSSIRAAMNLLPKEKIFGMVLNNVEPDECD